MAPVLPSLLCAATRKGHAHVAIGVHRRDGPPFVELARAWGERLAGARAPGRVVVGRIYIERGTAVPCGPNRARGLRLRSSMCAGDHARPATRLVRRPRSVQGHDHLRASGQVANGKRVMACSSVLPKGFEARTVRRRRPRLPSALVAAIGESSREDRRRRVTDCSPTAKAARSPPSPGGGRSVARRSSRSTRVSIPRGHIDVVHEIETEVTDCARRWARARQKLDRRIRGGWRPRQAALGGDSTRTF